MSKVYSLLVNGVESGYYTSNFPYPASRKIFRKFSKQLDLDSFEFRIINIKNRRTYYYFGERIKTEKEHTFKYRDQIRVFKVNYIYKITRIYN